MRKLNKKTYFLIFSILVILSSLFFYLNKDYYKKLILEKISSLIEYQISFESSEFSFLPFPEIKLNEFNLKSNDEIIQIDSKTISLDFSWKIIYGNVILKSISCVDSNLNYSFPEKIQNKSLDQNSLKKINSYIQLDEFEAENLILFDKNKNKKFNFKKVFLTHNHKDEVGIKLEYISENGKLSLESEIIYPIGKYEFEKLGFQSKIHFDKFNLIPFKEYYKYARQARFDNSNLSGNIFIKKEINSKELKINLDLEFEKLRFAKTNFYPNLILNSEIILKPEDEILISELSVKLPGIGIAKANGNINYKDNFILNLYINGEYGDVSKIIEIVLYSTDINFTSESDFYSSMKILVKKAKYESFDLENIDLDLKVFNTKVGLNLNNVNLLGGKVLAKGEILASNYTKYDFDCLVMNLNLEELISNYTSEKFLKGNLITNFKFSSLGNEQEQFKENFVANGKIDVKNGELLGYANFLKPIFGLGKLVNFLGPKGKNSGFQSLSTNFSIKNQLIQTPNIKMVGVGLDANGSGKITFARKLDYKINVGLGGMAGKVFFVPIIYKGTMPNNVSYIDPIWLGSVYLGTTFLAGPIGTTVGGIAGSTVSEYMRNSYESVKNFFGFGKKKEDE